MSKREMAPRRGRSSSPRSWPQGHVPPVPIIMPTGARIGITAGEDQVHGRQRCLARVVHHEEPSTMV